MQVTLPVVFIRWLDLDLDLDLEPPLAVPEK